MPNIRNNITEGSFLKSYLKYIFPLLLGGFIQQSYAIIDALIIGNFLGKEALAATDSPFVFIRLLVAAFLALASGGSILISLLFGAKDEARVKQTVQVMMKFSIIAGLVVTVLSIVLTPWGLRLMLVPEELRSFSQQYLVVYFTGTVFVLAYNMASGVMRAVGDSKNPFIYLAISALCNVVLDLLFVAVFKWGVIGAALATVLSQAFSAVLIVVKLMKVKDCYRFTLEKLNVEKGTLMRALKLGFPMAVQSAIFSIANMYMQRGINFYGTDAIAGWTIIGKVDIIVYIISETMGLTVITFVAQNLGAKNFPRIKQTLRLSLAMGLAIYGALAYFFYFYMNIPASVFTSDAGAIAKAVELAKIIAPFQFFYAIMEIYNSASKGAGNTFAPMMVTVLAIGVFRIIWMSFIYPLAPSVSLVISGYPVSWGLAALLAIAQYYIFSHKKLSPKVIEAR